jgi:Ca-activated chloride channel family protein
MRNLTGFGLAATALAMVLTACSSGNEASNDDTSSAQEAADAPGEAEVGAAEPNDGDQTFEDYGVNEDIPTAEQNQSTFALDVDTGSYSIVRAALTEGYLPDPASVRTEEFINYFAQDYEAPAQGMGIAVDGTAVPFLEDPAKHVIRVGLQGATVEDEVRKPVNLTVIADVSGSMEGEKLNMVKAGLARLVDSLRPDDRMAIVSYSKDAWVHLPMTSLAETASIHAAIADLESASETNLEAGLRLGYEHARETFIESARNRVVLLSDGVANVDETDPDVLASHIAQEAGDDTQLAVIGVGRDTYNDVILEQFADQGNGFYAFIDNAQEAERLFVDDLTATLQAVALDAKVQVTFNPEVVSGYRLLGYENRQIEDEEFRDDSVDGGEIGAGHTTTALYEVTLIEGTAGTELTGTESLAEVTVRWKDPETKEPAERSVVVTAADIAPSFDQAATRLQQDIIVAAFAEALREAPWSERVSLEQIAANAEALRSVLPEDADVAELATLARAAAYANG